MAIGTRFKNFVKRITRTTYDSPFGAKFTTAMGFKSSLNPYNKETTWFQIYEEQPFIRGALDTVVKAVLQQWSIENISDKEPTKREKSLSHKIETEWKMPEKMFKTKLTTSALKLIMDSVIISESSKPDQNFFNLNKQDWTVGWDKDNREIVRIHWKKQANLLGQNIALTADTADKTLEQFQFAIASIHDPDTNLWQLSVLETLVDVANLFWHSTRANIFNFSKGGVPSALFALDEKTSDPVFNDFVESVKTARQGENVYSRGNVKIHKLAGFNKDMEYEAVIKFGIQAIMSCIGISSYMMALADKTGGEKNETNVFTNTVHFFQDLVSNFVTWNMHNIWGNVETLNVNVDPEDESKGKVKIHGRPKTNPVRNLVFKLRKWVNPREQAALHKLYRDMGALTPNEIRSDIGKEESDQEGANDLMIGSAQPSGNVGADQPSREGIEQNPAGEGSDLPSSGDGSGTTPIQAAEDKRLKTQYDPVEDCEAKTE